MNKLAKALYDNTAECPDELAFKKGDILTVTDESVGGTSGWWMCSLYGRRGLAPANRLKLLPQPGTSAGSLQVTMEEPKLDQAESDNNMHNIYQIPSMLRPINSPAYESMDMIYNIPSSPLSTAKSPVQSALKLSSEGPEVNKASFLNASSSPITTVYDVPSQARRASLLTEATTPGQKKTFILELEERFDTPDNFRHGSQGNPSVYAVPPPLLQDPNYDIPLPSATETQQKMIGSYSTLPNPRKPEWIYDVPVGLEKQSPVQCNYDTLPLKSIFRPLHNFSPSNTFPVQRTNTAPSLYDIPKSVSPDISSPSKAPVYDSPPAEEWVYDVPANEEPFCQSFSDPSGDQKVLECKGDLRNTSELKRVRLQRMRNFLACATLRDLSGSGELLLQEDNRGRTCLTAPASKRISTASSSSNSSCDSLALSSSSPEPLREVALSQDEACRKLIDLQESVCRAVPQLMEFVSSNWRYKEHLEKHLKEIKEATERTVCSLMCFINFVLDVKGNARHLTDINLQTRLFKQLSIVEDSGVILQQTANALKVAGWPLDALSQDLDQVQTPDQLDRFVMVARTVPDDVRCLVSMIYANGKLLFKTPQKDLESVSNRSPPQTKKCSSETDQGGQSVEGDSDYVELQVEDGQPEKVQKKLRGSLSPESKMTADRYHSDSGSSSSTEEQPPPSLSEYSRLYFGALQKAIGGFVDSLLKGQPPEKFISQSKLVIMVGQRLVDSLCKEAHRQGSSQSLLCKSNHLCALLKQLAVATKKAALHFPDKQALQEVQEFAKELAQRAQHFRLSLDL